MITQEYRIYAQDKNRQVVIKEILALKAIFSSSVEQLIPGSCSGNPVACKETDFCPSNYKSCTTPLLEHS